MRASVDAGESTALYLLQIGGLRAVRPNPPDRRCGSRAHGVDCVVWEAQAQGRADAAAICNVSLEVPRASSGAPAGSGHARNPSMQSVRHGLFAGGLAAELSLPSQRSVSAAPQRSHKYRQRQGRHAVFEQRQSQAVPAHCTIKRLLRKEAHFPCCPTSTHWRSSYVRPSCTA